MPIKKVLYISTASNISGATLALLEIIDEIKKRGIDVSVVTAERGELEKRLRARSVRFYRARYASWLCREGERNTLTGKIKYAIKKLLEAYSELVITFALKQEKADIVHINTGISPVGLKSAHQLGIPVIWHIRELPWVYWKRKPYDADYEVRCLEEADCLIAISDYVKEQYIDKSPDNIIRLYDGVDTSAYANVRIEEILSDSIVRLSLCGGYEEKGHVDAICAVKILTERGFKSFRLSFWGNFIPEYKKELEEQIRAYGIEKWITFEGPTSEMPKKWGQTDIALVCSKGEAFGRVTVEAMAAGDLVIGASAGATPELLSNGRGLLYQSGNAEELADSIQYAVSHVEEVRTLASEGRRFVSSGMFSVKNYVDSLMEIYIDMISRRVK